MKRANFIGAPEFFDLNQACTAITAAYGYNLYLVGSSITKRDFRDVDLRCILDDDEFDQMFPGMVRVSGASGKVYSAEWTDARWSLLCASISAWLSSRTGLKIDFQFQRRTQANENYRQLDGHQRHAIGLFMTPAAPGTA